MTSEAITQQVREGSVLDVESDIPAGLTLAEYAAARRPRPSGRLMARMATIFLPRRPR
jgi:hypothetical protein